MKQFAPGLFRGPRPTDRDGIRTLKQQGIKTLINLQETEDYDEVISEIINLELENLDIEQRAIFPPRENHVALVLQALDNLDLHPIYLHCQAGVDRTGFMVAKYRLLQGMSKKSAIQEMKNEGMHWWFYWWGWFL